ncbi:hypothetical protein BT69DRAFT_1327698 [Atractiella rhizophila]|nr:hypothetical protein BT69DRAFT_1327698 [Atractiella rhizophila]
MERSSKATYLVSVTLLNWPAFESSTKSWSGLVPSPSAEDVAGHIFFRFGFGPGGSGRKWVEARIQLGGKPHLRESQAKLGSPLVLDNPHFVKPEMVMKLDDVMFRDWEVELELEMGLIKDEDE